MHTQTWNLLHIKKNTLLEENSWIQLGIYTSRICSVALDDQQNRGVGPVQRIVDDEIRPRFPRTLWRRRPEELWTELSPVAYAHEEVRWMKLVGELIYHRGR